MFKNTLLFLLYMLAVPVFAQSPDKLYEKDYNTFWCGKNQGVTEFKTIDGSRVDCLLPGYAVECDRAYKWKEATGQALFYALQTGRKPAILLIVEDEYKEKKYIDRLSVVASKYEIEVWQIRPKDLRELK